jgi:molybdopterin converting factor small subunit
MSVKINSVTATPAKLDSSLGEQEIVISWNATMTAASDNPVNFELKILSDNDPVYFVSNQNNNEKVVSWNQNLKAGDNDYQKTIVMIVNLSQAQLQVTKLRMLSKGSDGVQSRRHFALFYK